MKRLLSAVLLIAVLLSCCACGSKEQGTTEPASLDPNSPEAMYGHIDQTKPVDGYYKLWNADGVKNMANHPDGNFELLCNVDMGGATLAPIPEFTGTIKGGNFTISNFTLQGGDAESFGFVTVNKGTIQNLLLDQVTFVPSENAKNIGSLAGINEGTLSRCTVTGTITVETAADGATCGSAAGVSSGEVSNTVLNVDIVYNAPAAAAIGGIAGRAEGGKLEYVTTNGALKVTGSNKTMGVIAGEAKNVTLKTCAFVGAENSLDGKLVSDYFGAEENVTYEQLLRRDNSREPEDPKIQQKRERAVQEMYDMATVKWTVTEPVAHTCNCKLEVCNAVFSTDYTYYGLPYNHKNGSLARMKYCMNEDGTLKDFVYEMREEGTFETFDLYMGNDCSTAVQQAWLTVSNSVEFMRSTYQAPEMGYSMLPVGDWEWELGLDTASSARMTKNYTEHNGPEVMYKAYAQLRMGDGVAYNDENGHSRMCSSDAVVVYDENGQINGEYSYVLFHEQGVQVKDDEAKTYSMWQVNAKYTFNNLYYGYYLPVTIEEFVTGEFDTPECTLENGCEGRAGLTTGVVKANYSLDSVHMVITDDSGNTVFDHVMWPSVSRRLNDDSNDTHIRRVFMEYDLAGFATPLRDVMLEPGETYHCTITGNLSTYDSFVVKDYSFTNG